MPDSRSLPLRWGTRRTRVAWGGILIVSGGVAVAGSNTFVLLLLLAGILTHIAGWCIMPAAGWRRVLAIVLSAPSVVILITGPQYIGVLVLPYIAWLIVRHRPARSYPTVTFVLAGAVILPRIFPEYSQMLPALAIEFALIVASAWAAHAVDVSRSSRRPPELPS